MAILLCSMIRCHSNSQHPAEVILIQSSTYGHAAVQIPVSGYKLVILDPTGRYYSRNFWGNIVFNDITAEINNWPNCWKPQWEATSTLTESSPTTSTKRSLRQASTSHGCTAEQVEPPTAISLWAQRNNGSANPQRSITRQTKCNQSFEAENTAHYILVTVKSHII